jgi:transcriptional regulator with XRE-family HTH domain
MTFAERLKMLREKAGLKQTEVAARLEVPLSTYHSYEKKGTLPNVEMLLRLAHALGCTVDDLAGYEPPEFDAEAVKDYLQKFDIKMDCNPDAKDDDTVKVLLTTPNSSLPGTYVSYQNVTTLSQVKDGIKKSEKEADAALSEQRYNSLKGRLIYNMIISPYIDHVNQKYASMKEELASMKEDSPDIIEQLRKEHVKEIQDLYLAIMETMKASHEDGKGGAS